ncbi:MAG: polymer-forming cytoskeletal protein [Myxococcales bacterium]|nr:polymer-forming cytoskeletal protein [Myxococcales bacterium]
MSEGEKDLTGIGELQALLGRGTEFEGKLIFQGRVRIDGTLRGSVFSEDVLILGPSADVQADVEVGTLIVRGGSLKGDVTAHRLVEIYAPAKVRGDIRTNQLFLDKGVTFEGNCSLLEDAEAAPETPESAAEEASADE